MPSILASGSSLFLLALCACAASAAVRPAAPFGNNAVLQQGRPLPVWGSADPGERVTVTYASPALTRSASAVADAEGRWRVELPALPASSEPATLTFAGSGTLVREGVLVGEVWLASGQSNMAWALGWSNRITNAQAEIAAADFPLIREFTVRPAAADAPQTAVQGGSWRPCTPSSVKNFSAAAYFFARDLHRRLGVPVGIINASWGGSPIEPFMPRETLAAVRGGAPILARWEKTLAEHPARMERHREALAAWREAKAAAEKAGEPFTAKQPAPPPGPGHQTTPAGSYNAMIHPFVPCALRGVIWYQGESNVGGHYNYAAFFPALIKGWRDAFDQPDLPFYWVQLAAYAPGGSRNGTEYPLLREAQQRALLLPHTGQALAIDIGETGNIHPANKQDVGRRLALLALRRAYGEAGVIDTGPTLSKVELAAGAPDRIRVTFAELANGLKNTNAADPGAVLGFEVAGADKNFKPAAARVEDAAAGTVVLTAPAAVPRPAFVRYAFRNDPPNTLANSEGLPAAPFRTDP